jgi:hypothetical protein
VHGPSNPILLTEKMLIIASEEKRPGHTLYLQYVPINVNENTKKKLGKMLTGDFR